MSAECEKEFNLSDNVTVRIKNGILVLKESGLPWHTPEVFLLTKTDFECLIKFLQESLDNNLLR
jgi:hypothetical protein